MNLTIKQSNSFKRSVKKLPKQHKGLLDNEVMRLSNKDRDPFMGEKKKGSLDFLSVHKFKLQHQDVLLGYMYAEDELVLTLLKFGSHENFYRDLNKS